MKYFILFLFLISSIFSAEDIDEQTKKIKLKEVIRNLASKNYKYGDSIELDNNRVVLDASGTVQYIYKKALNIDLPRDSYSQYTFLVDKKKLKVSLTDFATARVNIEDTINKLKIGDLLFWTNTYENIPEYREPPIGHVMIYIGKDVLGNLLMIGSNTYSKGYINDRPGGGPDIYFFDPNQIMGCGKREIKGNKNSSCIKGYESQFFGFGQP